MLYLYCGLTCMGIGFLFMLFSITTALIAINVNLRDISNKLDLIR